MKIRVIEIILIIVAIIAIVIIGPKVINKIYNIQYQNRIEEVTSDSVEIEKKWIVDINKMEYDLSKAIKVYEIEQSYICFSPEIRVRRVNNGNQYSFTVKTNMSEDGLIRDELDFLITEEEYNNLIAKKEGNTILKTRYKFLEQDQVVVIDVFKGELEGLAYMEIEFANEQEANSYEEPDWVIKDVTSDIRYKNGHLARFGIPKEN